MLYKDIVFNTITFNYQIRIFMRKLVEIAGSYNIIEALDQLVSRTEMLLK